MNYKTMLSHAHVFDCPEGITPGEHSAWLDRVLGFRVESIEHELYLEGRKQKPDGNVATWGSFLHSGNQTWVGLAPETLQTPYSELKRACDLLRPQEGSVWVDLGAGYGRLAVVLQQFPEKVSFYGYEFVKERVAEGNRLFERIGIEGAKLYEADLSSPDFFPPVADVYFIYDYGHVPHIKNTLKQIEKIADHRNIKVIARGQGVRSIIENEHPWLSQVHAPIREENFSIYSMEF